MLTWQRKMTVNVRYVSPKL